MGDLVDIWYDPPNKDAPGWRGPAQISSISIDDGSVIARFQGRTRDRRHQEVRVHMPYLVVVFGVLPYRISVWQRVRNYVKGLMRCQEILGAIYIGHGWPQSERTREHGLQHLHDALVLFRKRSHCSFGTGRSKHWPDKRHKHSELLIWIRGRNLEDVTQYAPNPGKPRCPIKCERLAYEIEEVDLGHVPWTEVCFLEVLSVNDTQSKLTFESVIEIPLLCDAGTPRPVAEVAPGTGNATQEESAPDADEQKSRWLNACSPVSCPALLGPLGASQGSPRETKRDKGIALTPGREFIDLAPRSSIPRSVPYLDPRERPEEGILRVIAKVGSLDSIFAGDPAWIPSINSAFGLKRKFPPKCQIPTKIKAKRTNPISND